METPFRFGIDLGGSKIELLALDRLGAERHRERVATPAGDYEATLDAIERLVRAAEHMLGARGSIGVASPGAVSRASGRIKNANSTCLNGRALREDLAASLGREVRIANDANCFALSEARDGAGQGAPVVFGAILGTGVGGGIVVDGGALEGANAIAGEWGHNALPSPEAIDLPLPRCYCGRAGCIETYLSGSGLSTDHGRTTGEVASARGIAERAAAGDGACERSIARYAARLARSLAMVVNLLDPDVIVLGGGLSQIAALYRDVPRLWGEHVFSDEVRTRLLPPRHGAASGARGAAWLWPAARP